MNAKERLDETTKELINAVKHAIENPPPPDIVPVDQNGHLFTTDTADLHLYKQLRAHYESLTRQGRPPYPLSSALDFYHECYWCGVRPRIMFDEAYGIVRTLDPCPAVDGVRIEFDLHAPSGKLVVNDDLRQIYEPTLAETEAMYPYGTAIGQAQYCQAMAALGCAYGPVGNTCPGIYRVAPDEYAIVAGAGVIDDNEDDTPPPGEYLGSVCTDLWAYSIADHDDYVSRGGVLNRTWAGPFVVDVEPGTYHFVHHSGERGFDPDDYKNPIVYAHFSRVDT